MKEVDQNSYSMTRDILQTLQISYHFILVTMYFGKCFYLTPSHCFKPTHHICCLPFQQGTEKLQLIALRGFHQFLNCLEYLMKKRRHRNVQVLLHNTHEKECEDIFLSIICSLLKNNILQFLKKNSSYITISKTVVNKPFSFSGNLNLFNNNFSA